MTSMRVVTSGSRCTQKPDKTAWKGGCFHLVPLLTYGVVQTRREVPQSSVAGSAHTAIILASGQVIKIPLWGTL